MSENESIVYIYGFSIQKNDKIRGLIDIFKQQIENGVKINLVLIHDAVIRTSKNSQIPSSLKDLLNLPITIYTLLPDLEARGIDSKNIRDKIYGIGYDELVDILVENHKIVSWM